MSEALYFPNLNLKRVFQLLADHEEELGDAADLMIMSTDQTDLFFLQAMVNELVEHQISVATVFLTAIVVGYGLAVEDTA